MTDKEINQAWEYLGEACYWCHPIIKFNDLPNDFKNEAEELYDIHAFVNMLSSVLTYDIDYTSDLKISTEEIAKKVLNESNYARKYAEPLGRNLAIEYTKEMVSDYIDNAQILVGVGQDGEGLSYNSTKFKDRPTSNLGKDFMRRCKNFRDKVQELSETDEYKQLKEN